jgi:hypothetical protein
MAYWSRFLHKLRNFLQPGRAERDLAREIGSYWKTISGGEE